MLPAGIELAIRGSKRPQTHALDRAATWICNVRVSATILPISNKNNWSMHQQHKLLSSEYDYDLCGDKDFKGRSEGSKEEPAAMRIACLN